MDSLKRRFKSRQFVSGLQIRKPDVAEGASKCPSNGVNNNYIEADSKPINKLQFSKRHLNVINSLFAVKLRMLLITITVISLTSLFLCVQAGFFTFYLPNAFKPKGFDEISDMIEKMNVLINETKDQYADTRYFWGLMKKFDSLSPSEFYPEESACDELFPLFRDLATEYSQIDYEHYIKPFEEFKEHLEQFRSKWYPLGLESKAALPREWEQKLLEFELSAKIRWFELLTNNEEYRNKRQQMIDIWKKVRRNLDQSLPCTYLRYAYRQVAEDISQVALESNLEGFRQAQKVLLAAYKRIEKYKDSDKQVIVDIMEDIEKQERFTIKD